MQITRRWNWLNHVVVLLIGLLMLYPILWLISSSFKPSYLIFSDLRLWPTEVTLDNYSKGWAGIARLKFGTFITNSFVVATLSVIGNIIGCSLAAYAFGRLQFSLKKLWFGIMMITIMLPYHVTVIPQYILFEKIGWINSYLPLITPKFLATEAFYIFLMVQFVRGLPRELDESATIDGCGPIRIFWNIILPLMVPAIITTSIFTFMGAWDDFFSQLLFLNSANKYTIPLGLRLFMDASGASSWGPLLAMSVVALIPCLLLFFALQKHFVEGISTTGLKG
ncbi:carbohydrate ABC transporter permease [Paenibacillus yanchengensis]|uniref:Carbohydrate ABC transporter permease n=1 Tax=Paenibacillus yanchengensis TaxID=2035833 RepID=A0ABW4YNY1_9BACL